MNKLIEQDKKDALEQIKKPFRRFCFFEVRR